MTDFLILFICLSTVNVVFSTIRSIITIKGGKLLASLFSAGYFAFYNIMMVYTVMDFSMWHKCIITFVCNFVGVFLVKWGEEHFRKDELWYIVASVRNEFAEGLRKDLVALNIDNDYILNVGKNAKFNIYSYTQRESAEVRKLMKKYNAKYCVLESKTLD